MKNRSRFILAGLALATMTMAGCQNGDGMDEQREWCHDHGGYIANTGWYEWKCVIDGVPVNMPSPRDQG